MDINEQPYRRSRRSVLVGTKKKTKGGILFLTIGVFIMVTIVYLLYYTSSHVHIDPYAVASSSKQHGRGRRIQQQGGGAGSNTKKVDDYDDHGTPSFSSRGGGSRNSLVSEITLRWVNEHLLPLSRRHHRAPASQRDEHRQQELERGFIGPDNYLVSNALRIVNHYVFGSTMSEMLTLQINKMVSKISRRRGITVGGSDAPQMMKIIGDGEDNNKLIPDDEALALQAKYADLWGPIFDQFSGGEDDALDVASSCLFMTPECAFFLREDVVEMERDVGKLSINSTSTSPNKKSQHSPITLSDLQSLGHTSGKQGVAGTGGFLFSKCCLEHREMLNALACSVAVSKSSPSTSVQSPTPPYQNAAAYGVGGEYDNKKKNAHQNNKQVSDTAILLSGSGLDVWPTAGTLLGLVRQEGGTLIPWDTDIDLLVDVSPPSPLPPPSSKPHPPPTPLSEDSIDRKLADVLFPALWGRRGTGSNTGSGSFSRHFFQPKESERKERRLLSDILLQLNEITLDGIISESLGSKTRRGGNKTTRTDSIVADAPPDILHPKVAASLRRAVVKASSSSASTSTNDLIFKGKSPSTIILSKFMSLLPTTILEKHTISASFPFLSQIVVVQKSSTKEIPSPTLSTTPFASSAQIRALTLVHRGTPQSSSSEKQRRLNNNSHAKASKFKRPLASSSLRQPLLSCFAVKANKQSDHGRIGAVIYGTSSFRHSEASRVELWIRQESRKMQKAAINLPFYSRRSDGGEGIITQGFPTFNVSLVSIGEEGLETPPSVGGSPSDLVRSPSSVCRTGHGDTTTTTNNPTSNTLPIPSSAHIQSMVNVLLNDGDYRAISAHLFKEDGNDNKGLLNPLGNNEGGDDITRRMNLACPKDPTAILEAGYGPLWCRPCKHRTSNCKNV